MKSTALSAFLEATASALALLIIAGCANTAQTVSSTNDLDSVGGDKVVYGQLKLVRNGVPADLGHGVLASTATLNLHATDSNQKFVGKIGDEGEFSWALPSGTYRVESVAFRYQGQTIRPETNFTFTVSPDFDATYLGTVEVEATLDAGYAGVQGTIDRFVVRDHCSSDCGRRLDEMGLADTASTQSLLRWDRQ